MKYYNLLLVYFFFSIFYVFGQKKSYGSVQIGNWTLEKFPKHYLTKAYKIHTEKDPFTKKLVLWEQLDQYGRNKGLRIEFQNNGIYPATADYYYNGKGVYSAEFFPNSKKASYIRNKNIEDIVDGPQVERYDDYNGGITEQISFFEDGEDINREEKPYGFDNNLNWVNGLLDGNFYFSTPNLSKVEGFANNGDVTFLQIKTFSDIKTVLEFKDDFVISRVIYSIKDETTGNLNKSETTQKFKFKPKSKITNEKKFKDKKTFFYCGSAYDKIVNEINSYIIRN